MIPTPQQRTQTGCHEHHEEDLRQGNGRPNPSRNVIPREKHGDERPQFQDPLLQVHALVYNRRLVVDQDYRYNKPEIRNQRVVAAKRCIRNRSEDHPRQGLDPEQQEKSAHNKHHLRSSRPEENLLRRIHNALIRLGPSGGEDLPEFLAADKKR